MFYFTLAIPFISIHTETMRQCYEKDSYTYIAWHIQIWKWHWTLYWGKSRQEEYDSKTHP